MGAQTGMAASRIADSISCSRSPYVAPAVPVDERSDEFASSGSMGSLAFAGRIVASVRRWIS